MKMVSRPSLLQELEKVYEPLGWSMKNFSADPESVLYEGATFLLQNKRVCFRKAKITPKKVGQFVTIWTRDDLEKTRPFNVTDDIDILVIYVESGEHRGQFVFSFDAATHQGLFSTPLKVGKRGFRVYPPWDVVNNSEAKRTQQKYLPYFVKLDQIGNESYHTISRLYGLL